VKKKSMDSLPSIMAKKTLLGLLQSATRKEFFSKDFLQGLYRELAKALK
jgi:hypothetical protein